MSNAICICGCEQIDHVGMKGRCQQCSCDKFMVKPEPEIEDRNDGYEEEIMRVSDNPNHDFRPANEILEERERVDITEGTWACIGTARLTYEGKGLIIDLAGGKHIGILPLDDLRKVILEQQASVSLLSPRPEIPDIWVSI